MAISETYGLEDVFKLSGIPTVTFVQPRAFSAIKVNLRTKGRGLVIEGPSGVGKTTAVDRALNELGLAAAACRLSARKREDLDLIRDIVVDPSPGLVIIDDFHKLPADLKESLADRMKVAADEEATKFKIVLIGINDAGKSLVSFAQDIAHRLDIIGFGSEEDERVAKLVEKGEAALNISINVAQDIVAEARGSFFIAQLLCHEACLMSQVIDRQPAHTVTAISFESIRSRVFERLDRDFEARTRRFAQGPKMRRAGRAPYLNLLVWLAETADWSLSIGLALRQHPRLRESVTRIVNQGRLEEFIQADPQISAVLHYDSQSQMLTVEDPKYVFYIRNLSWKQFAKDIGFISVDFSEKYDVALSFAGSDRDVAEALFHQLAGHELEVFYDRNEQHRILAEDIEEYIRPIYLSDALLVVCLLGPEYPRRIWTKFEAEIIRERLGRKAVIPIWFDVAPPGVFDDSRRVGGLEFCRSADLGQQVAAITELLVAKVGDARRAGQ